MTTTKDFQVESFKMRKRALACARLFLEAASRLVLLRVAGQALA